MDAGTDLHGWLHTLFDGLGVALLTWSGAMLWRTLDRKIIVDQRLRECRNFCFRLARENKLDPWDFFSNWDGKGGGPGS